MQHAARMTPVGCTGAPKFESTAESVGQVAQKGDEEPEPAGGHSSDAGAGSDEVESSSEIGHRGNSGSNEEDDG